MPHQRLTAQELSSREQRSVETDSDGRFTFAPLAHGTYTIHGAGQFPSGVRDEWSRPLASTAAIVYPVRLTLKAGVRPESVELREAPGVTIEARALDSQGRPARYSPIALTGFLPDRTRSGGAATETVDPPSAVPWGTHSLADSEGRIVLRAPRGLYQACLNATLRDSTVAVKTQLSKNAAPVLGGLGQLGTLNEDRRDITLTYFKAPTLLITVKPAMNEQVADTWVNGRWRQNGVAQRVSLMRLSDGRFRTSSMPADQACTFSAFAVGYEADEANIKLPEGAVKEITLELRKRDEAE